MAQLGIHSTIFLTLLIGLANCQPSKPIFSAKDEVDDADLSCAACLAVVDIVENTMAKKSFDGIETRLYDLLETVCEQGNYRTYDFIPPKMAEACKKFVDKVEDEELVAVFKNYYAATTRNPRDRYLLERKVCLNISGDCVGNKRIESKEKKAPTKLGGETPEQDKQFQATVDDLMSQHGHKMREAKPVKHGDEL